MITAHTFRGAISISADSLAGFVSDSNAVTPRFTLDGGSSVLDLDDWQRTTGRDAHSFAATPAALFLDAAAANYNLRADSPARDTAVAATDVTTDYDGRPRPIGPLPDIGADEFGELATTSDLFVSALSSPPATVRRGGRFVITDTVVNGGGVAAGATVTRYFLSVDGARGPGDRMLEARRSVPALAPGATSSGTVAVMVPAATPRGAYVLLACADAGGAVAESSETNNAARRRRRWWCGSYDKRGARPSRPARLAVTSKTPPRVAAPPAISTALGRPPKSTIDQSQVTTGVSVRMIVRKLMSSCRRAR